MVIDGLRLPRVAERISGDQRTQQFTAAHGPGRYNAPARLVMR